MYFSLDVTLAWIHNAASVYKVGGLVRDHLVVHIADVSAPKPNVPKEKVEQKIWASTMNLKITHLVPRVALACTTEWTAERAMNSMADMLKFSSINITLGKLPYLSFFRPFLNSTNLLYHLIKVQLNLAFAPWGSPFPRQCPSALAGPANYFFDVVQFLLCWSLTTKRPPQQF